MDAGRTKIKIDKNCNLVYSSFYIYGLYKLFSRRDVSFGDLRTSPKNLDGFRFIICKNGGKTKVAISLSDNYQINEIQYDWCDVYGSVNANFSKTPEKYHDKLRALCPSFGIKIWNVPQTLFYAMKNISKSDFSPLKFVGKYKQQLQRLPYENYTTQYLNKKVDNYIFSLSTLWYSDEWNKNDEGVNARRANFIRACKELNEVSFEGGLVSQGKERSSESIFADCLSNSISMKDWMEKTNRSVLVFNTPAFWDCHGWKLGEYLAMGKCIISTELSNDLPAPLEHGKNIHFVENDKDAMKEAVRYIINHPDYRANLERGAREYWEQYGSPVASLKLLGIAN